MNKREKKMKEAIRTAILILEMGSKIDIVPMLKAAIAKENDDEDRNKVQLG